MPLIFVIVSLNTQVSMKNIESDGVIDREEFLDEENSQFQNQPSFLVDSATTGRMVKCLFQENRLYFCSLSFRIP
jgi:hypothetical protein